MITYQDTLEGVNPSQLEGFFIGWPKPLSGRRFYEVLAGSQNIWIARDGEQVVGFINAIGDGGFSAFIPLLEVRPEYQGRGIGKGLVRRMMDSLADHYSIDLVCETDLIPFYEKVGLMRLTAMSSRNRSYTP